MLRGFFLIIALFFAFALEPYHFPYPCLTTLIAFGIFQTSYYYRFKKRDRETAINILAIAWLYVAFCTIKIVVPSIDHPSASLYRIIFPTAILEITMTTCTLLLLSLPVLYPGKKAKKLSGYNLLFMFIAFIAIIDCILTLIVHYLSFTLALQDSYWG